MAQFDHKESVYYKTSKFDWTTNDISKTYFGADSDLLGPNLGHFFFFFFFFEALALLLY